jgi:hypothetical protein
MAIFMSHCPQFWVSRRICMPRKNPYMFEIYDQKLVVFMFMVIFMSYYLEFLCSKRICMVCQTRYMFGRYDQKLVVFMFYGRVWVFSWAIAHSFGVPGGFACLVRTLTCLRDMTRNSSFLCFMVVFMSYCPRFWGSMLIYKDLKTRHMFEL